MLNPHFAMPENTFINGLQQNSSVKSLRNARDILQTSRLITDIRFSAAWKTSIA